MWDWLKGISSRNASFTLACVIDQHPRFHVELVLWTLCAKRFLPKDRYRTIAYFVGEGPQDLVDWVRAQGVETREFKALVEGSPHCNKIGPFFDTHATDYIIVSDADVFLVDDPSVLIHSMRFRAPPNNRCHPPPHIFQAVLAATALGRVYRPGMAVCRGNSGMRETHRNNICGSFVVAPTNRSEELARLWKKWAQWLVANRRLLESESVFVDQVAFALTMEELREDVELLPPQVNAIPHILDEIATVYGFHLSTNHIPKFPERFNADRTMKSDGVAEGVAGAIGRLNDCIKDAVGVISAIPSTQGHIEKFFNPNWRR